MARRQKTAKRPKPKTVLRLPDLEQSKNAVLNSPQPGRSGRGHCGPGTPAEAGHFCLAPRITAGAQY